MSPNIHDRQILYLKDLKTCDCHFKDGNTFLAYKKVTSHCDRRCGCRIYRGHQFQLLAVTPFCLQQLHSRQVTFFLPAFPLFLDTGVSSGTRPGRGETHAHRKDGGHWGNKGIKWHFMYQRLTLLFVPWDSIQTTAFLSFNVLSARLALRPVNYRWAAGPRHAAAPAVAPVKSCCSPAFRSTHVQFLVISDNQASVPATAHSSEWRKNIGLIRTVPYFPNINPGLILTLKAFLWRAYTSMNKCDLVKRKKAPSYFGHGQTASVCVSPCIV